MLLIMTYGLDVDGSCCYVVRFRHGLLKHGVMFAGSAEVLNTSFQHRVLHHCDAPNHESAQL
jgi:hypothetical protein